MSQGQARTVLPVSAIVPAYNAALFLGEALGSVQSQTAAPAEVIVVDDGSTDETAALAEQTRVRVLRCPHQGLSATRNEGIRAASQPWIAFLDADDLWEPAKLESQWVAVQECPGVGMVFTDFSEFSASGILVNSFLSRRRNYRGVERTEVAPGVMCCKEESLRRQFLKGNFIAPSTVLVRRDLLLQVSLFDTTLKRLEDRELWLRLLAVSRAAVVERPLMRSRLHDSNMSHDALEMVLGALMVTDRVFASPGKYPRGAVEHYRKEQPKLYLNAGRFAEELGEIERARGYYLASWRSGGGLRPLTLAALSHFPRFVRRVVKAAVRSFRGTLETPSV